MGFSVSQSSANVTVTVFASDEARREREVQGRARWITCGREGESAKDFPPTTGTVVSAPR